jgi:hypothetical protein
VVGALFLPILAACDGLVASHPESDGGAIVVSRYDQSCSEASDCAWVWTETPTCCAAECPYAAINRSDVSRYEADYASRCEGIACSEFACVAPSVACVEGKCEAVGGGPAPPHAADSGVDATGGGGTACRVDADCGNGFACGFPEADACAAVGTCFQAAGALCDAYLPGCACDGTTFSTVCTGLPSGYVSKPLDYEGSCHLDVDAGAAHDAATSAD